MDGEPTTKSLWLRPGPIIAGVLLLVTLFGVGAFAAGCNVLPRLVAGPGRQPDADHHADGDRFYVTDS